MAWRQVGHDMVHKRRDMWGFAVGNDRRGERRRISIYRTQDGFEFVSETLYSHSLVAPGKPSAEQLRGEVAKEIGRASCRERV